MPEWRVKYLDYKVRAGPGQRRRTRLTLPPVQQAKKKLKAVARAHRGAHPSPLTPLRRAQTFFSTPTSGNGPVYSPLNPGRGLRAAQNGAFDNADSALQEGTKGQSAPKDIPGEGNREQEPLVTSHPSLLEEREDGKTRYGSIIGTPPKDQRRRRGPSLLELPDPALDPVGLADGGRQSDRDKVSRLDKSLLHPTARTDSTSAFEVGRTRHPLTLPARLMSNSRTSSPRGAGANGSSGPLAKKFLSLRGGKSRSPVPDMPLQAYRDFELRQREFFDFLDLELNKVESFYKEKEDQATRRLKVLREQLHIMRDARIEELMATAARNRHRKRKAAEERLMSQAEQSTDGHAGESGQARGPKWAKPLDGALRGARRGRIGRTTTAMNELGTPSALQAQDTQRDYSRRPIAADVSYRTAKRKLKIALAEFYHAVELLKSYALLNRTAFRKINKKYDKTVNARPPQRYMTEKVSNAWFVKSDVLDGYIHTVEDLYARYFERGNHKVAAGKLRAKSARVNDYDASVFRNGVMATVGLLLGIQGVVEGGRLLFSADRVLAVRTSYLLQVIPAESAFLTLAKSWQLYAGYFLILLLVLLFCLACRIWKRAKINYVFIFEFDTRHHLDWRQLCEVSRSS